MKNKTLGAKNLQKVGVFFDIRPYLYINKEWRVESGEWRVESGEFDGTNETNETNKTNGRNFQRTPITPIAPITPRKLAPL